jgi:hypothetical protein
MELCPFSPGDSVVYRPTRIGRDKSIMTDYAALEVGKEYRVVRVVNGRYVLIEGFENSPGGGMCWSEFSFPARGPAVG